MHVSQRTPLDRAILVIVLWWIGRKVIGHILAEVVQRGDKPSHAAKGPVVQQRLRFPLFIFPPIAQRQQVFR